MSRGDAIAVVVEYVTVDAKAFYVNIAKITSVDIIEVAAADIPR